MKGPFFVKTWKRKKLEKEGFAISKRRVKEDQTIGYAVDRSKIITFLIFLIIWFFCLLIMILPVRSKSGYSYLVKGQIAPKSIYSKFNFIYLNKEATKEKLERIKRDIPIVFELNVDKAKSMIEMAEKLVKEIAKYAKLGYVKAKDEKIAKIPIKYYSPINDLIGTTEKLENFKQKLIPIIYSGIISENDRKKISGRKVEICIIDNDKQYFREPIDIKSIDTPKEAINRFVKSMVIEFSPNNRSVMRKGLRILASLFIEPNLFYNKRLTNLEEDAAMASAKNSVYSEVNKGDIIVLKGEKVTQRILERFNAYQKERSKRQLYSNFKESFLYYLIISAMIVVIIVIYFYNLYPKIFQSNQKMGLTAFVIVISGIGIFIGNYLFNILVAEYNIPRSLETVFLPLGITPVLLAVFCGLRVATFSSLLVALVASIKLENSFIVLLTLAIGSISAYIVRNAKNYKKYFITTVVATSFVFSAAELLGQIKSIMHDPKLILWILLFSILNGIVTGLLAIVFLFILESLFKESTDMSRLSLCDYNHPLLKRLQLEAPGTYHHSLMVSSLVEQAAIALGANPIKARVCALFHDIGKLYKPNYFTENNPNSSDRHKNLTPAMSSMIIINHVKEGITLALQHKLSKEIRDAIEQHHGTDLVYYFYVKALENVNNKSEISEAEYRYPGPKPRDKEIVILSLADAIEAASRSLVKPTPSKIESLVSEIIRKKVRDGQLNEANFTFRDLALVKQSFVKTLTSMLHSRISYPDDINGDKDEGDLFQAVKEMEAKSK